MYLRFMIRAILLGSGNVAVHLASAIGAADGISLVQRYARGNSNSSLFDPDIPFTNDLGQLKEAELYIIAIKDDLIGEFSEGLRSCKGLVVHTSGSIGINELRNGSGKGVLYPVQTFSAGHRLDFRKVPLAIETEREEDLQLLKKFASGISDEVYEVSSERRKMLHLAAVFANNFSNHMFAQAEQICQENSIPFDLLGPLMNETVRKAIDMGPYQAQTGPAKRGDRKVLKKQEEMLKDDKKHLYKTLSDAIRSAYNK